MTPRETNDALRLSHCTQCDYALHGLPESGRCPECGTAYDAATIELRGWAMGSRRNATNARLPLPMFFGLLSVVLGQLAIYVTIGGQQRAIVFILFAAAVALVAVILLRRRVSRGAGVATRVRLSPAGFGQRDGAGDVKLHPWEPQTHLKIGEIRPGWCRIVLSKREPSFWKLMEPTVDCEFEMSYEFIELLRQRIGNWISHARDVERRSVSL